MPDFIRYVREKLGPLPLAPEREAEIVEEIAGHIRVAFEEARRQGMGEDEALALAEGPFVPWDALRKQIEESERTLGTEAARLERGIDDYLIARRTGSGGRLAGLVADLWQDLRFALRSFRRRPAFSVPAILTLALAIGATTAIFSFVDGILLQPLEYPAPERLVALEFRPVEATSQAALSEIDPWMRQHFRTAVSYPSFEDWRRSSTDIFEQLAAYDDAWRYRVAFEDGSDLLPGAWVSSNLFPLLGVQPLIGRTFTEQEDAPDSEPVVIVNHRLWQSRFAGDSGILGQVLHIEEDPYTIIGVMPPDFRFPGPEIAFWRPMAGASRNSSSTNYELVGRLCPEISRERANTLLGQRVVTQSTWEYDEDEWTCSVISLHDAIIGDTRRLLLVFLAAAAAVLLIACVNVMNLMFTRITDRQKENFVRAALGAGRRRLVRQLLAESLLVSLLGGLVGLGVAAVMAEVLLAISPSSIPRLDLVGIDVRVLVFLVAVSMAVGLAVGLIPAVRTARSNLAAGLNTGGRGLSGSLRHHRIFHGLVIVQLSLALILLVSAGLLLKSFAGMLAIERGFDPHRIVAFETDLPRSHYQTFEDHKRYYDELLGRLQIMPGVSSAAIAPYLPGTEWFHTYSFAPPALEVVPGEEPSAEFKEVSPGYFATLGITLLAGRLFTADDKVGDMPAAVINEEMARRYWPDGEVLGSSLLLDPGYDSERRVTVVGIVNDVRLRPGSRVRGDEEKYQIYVPFSVWGHPRRMDVLIRSETGLDELMPLVRQALAAIDPGVTVFGFSTLEHVLSERVATPRFRTLLLGAFGLVALILAVVGVYGVMAYAVAQRTREMGLRKALGAHQGQIMQEVFRRGLGLTLIGLGIGLAGAWVVAALLESYLYELTVHDPATFLFSSLGLAVSALLACALPAGRAARVDPMVALREE